MTISSSAVKKKSLLFLVLLWSLAAGACSRSAAQALDPSLSAEPNVAQNPAPSATSPSPQPKQLGQADPEVPVEEPPATQIATSNPTVAPTVEPPAAQPTEPMPTAFTFVPSDRTALVSTNPADFSLVSGQLQFVEFMAFW